MLLGSAAAVTNLVANNSRALKKTMAIVQAEGVCLPPASWCWQGAVPWCSGAGAGCRLQVTVTGDRCQ